ncbi:MAG: DUF5071 domain-containing protein [Planctomycetota bacterium]|nr:DUF5071 domain-containing protein [Planctomycetota bacterium]
MTDFDAYVPRHKCDIERAEAAVRLGYPEAEPILGRLIEWLQDYNWPVAHIIAPFLASIGRPVVPQIWLVLRSDDMQWKYWVISQVIRFLPNHVALEFRSELERLAYRPEPSERIEYVSEVAGETLHELGCSVPDA